MRTSMVVAVEPDVKPLGLSGDFRTNLKEVSRMGYDGVELHIKDPDKVDPKNIRELTQKFNLSVPAIGTGLTYVVYGLSFSSPDRAIRRKAVKRVQEYLKIGEELNSRIIVGSIQGRAEDPQSGMENLKDSLIRCAELGEETGTRIVIEPLNRYESNLVNTLDQAIRLREEIGSELVGVMADTYHMNIEEKSIYQSLTKADGYLEHVHFADNNRLAPGQGHINFKEVMRALKEINYDFFISAEILPLPSQYSAAELTMGHLKSIR